MAEESEVGQKGAETASAALRPTSVLDQFGYWLREICLQFYIKNAQIAFRAFGDMRVASCRTHLLHAQVPVPDQRTQRIWRDGQVGFGLLQRSREGNCKDSLGEGQHPLAQFACGDHAGLRHARAAHAGLALAAPVLVVDLPQMFRVRANFTPVREIQLPHFPHALREHASHGVGLARYGAGNLVAHRQIADPAPTRRGVHA